MMIKPFRLFIALQLLLLLPVLASAQGASCPQFPGPCPHSEEINQAMDFAGREEGNTVTPQEMAMEANLRNAVTDVLHKLTHAQHWRLYELMESDYDRPDGTVSYDKWRSTPYEKRPPHPYEITFIIVVNKDSMQAWKDWYNNVLPQQANQQVENIRSEGQSEADDPVLKALTDSVQYYTMLSGKYTQDHYAEFASDIQNNNQKGIKKYNDQIAMYNKRSDVFMKKLQDHVTNKRAPSAGSYNNFASEKVKKTDQFINASIVLLHFSFNPQHVNSGLTDNFHNIDPQKKLAVPGAYYAGLLHNPSAPDGQSYYIGEHDFTYDHPQDIGVVLFGKWQPTRDTYNYMSAAYLANKTAHDLVSIKSMKCDIVQNMMLQAEGRPDYIKQVFSLADMNALQKLIGEQLNQ